MKKYVVTLLNALAVFAALLLLWQMLVLLLHLPAYMLPAASRPWAGLSSPVSLRWPPRLPSLRRKRPVDWQLVSWWGS